MINSPFQAPLGGGRQARGQRTEHAQDRNAHPQALAARQRLDAEQRTNDHGLQRQGRQSEAGPRRRRVADGHVVEDEEQAEEAEAQHRHRGPIPALRPAHA